MPYKNQQSDQTGKGVCQGDEFIINYPSVGELRARQFNVGGMRYYSSVFVLITQPILLTKCNNKPHKSRTLSANAEKRGVASISSRPWLAIWLYRGLKQKLGQRLVTHFRARLSQQTRRASALTTSNEVYQLNS